MTEASEFVTALGCTVSLHPAPEHLSPGWLLCLDMRGDGRHAEVFLNEGNAQSLRGLLMAEEPVRDAESVAAAYYRREALADLRDAMEGLLDPWGNSGPTFTVKRADVLALIDEAQR